MSIFVGYRDNEKQNIIADYIANHNIKKTFVISPHKFPLLLDFEIDNITFEDAIKYVVFYRLLQEIDESVLIVINECLRTQNRYELTYNCIRNFLNQTTHRLIFNQLPIIDTQEDFMILFDFDTQSCWKRTKFNLELVKQNSNISCVTPQIEFSQIQITSNSRTKKTYENNKQKLYEQLLNKESPSDPHVIPRRLYLLSGKDKLAYVNSITSPLFNEDGLYVARNKRLKHHNIHSYSEFDKTQKYTILEFQHRFIDFADFMRTNWQFEFNVITTELKVGQWYFNRYVNWSNRINATCASLQTE